MSNGEDLSFDGGFVAEKADLTILKEIDGGTGSNIVVGSTITWKLTVGNIGDSQVSAGYRVIDTLPDEVSFISAEGEGFTCEEAEGIVTCESTEPLPGNVTAAPILLSAKMERFPSDGEILNVAVVEASGALSETVSNNTDSVALAVSQQTTKPTDSTQPPAALAQTNAPSPLAKTGRTIVGLLALGLVLVSLGSIVQVYRPAIARKRR